MDTTRGTFKKTIASRFTEAEISEIEEWIATLPVPVSISAGVRALAQFGLEAEQAKAKARGNKK